MPAIAVKHTSTVDTAWDGPAAKTNLKLDQPQDYYEKGYAWRDGAEDADPRTKAAYKFIHHEVDADGKIGAANMTACSSAIGVLNGGMGGTKIPDADKKGVWEHLAAHLKDGGKDVPDLKSHRGRSNKGSLSVHIKALQDDGSFEGSLAVYSNVDLGGDSILPGAFTKTLKDRGNEVPLLWQHNPDEPIGTLTLSDGPDALHVKGQLTLDTDANGNYVVPTAIKAYVLIKAKVIKGLSIGFDTIKDSVENGVRQLKELRLWEGSIVTFPMNEAAGITAVKRRGKGVQILETKDDFNGELAAVQLQDAGWQMRCALFMAIGSAIWASGLSKEEKVTAVETIIEQFSEAFMAYLPQYLDWLAAEYGDMETMGRLRMEEKSLGAIFSRSVKSVAGVHALELKEGRKFSSDTMKSLKEAHGHVKDMDDIFNALFDSEADDDPEDPADDTDDEDVDSDAVDQDGDTPGSKAAKKGKTEPVIDHSAAEQILNDMRTLIPKA
jgi:hypothetical protein